MEVKGLFWKDETIGRINEVQLLDLISTSISNVFIETSLVSPVHTKQVRKAVRYLFTRERNGTISYRFCSHENGTERYDMVSFQFLVHFSVPPNFWTCFGTDRLISFHTRVNATPPLFGTDRSGTVRYRTRVNRA